MRPLLIVGCLLLLPKYSAQAQEPEKPAPAPRWYVGVQYGRQDYQLAFAGPAGISNPGRTNARRPQLTLGYRLTPKTALQLGAAPLRQTFSYGASGTNNAGQPVSERGMSTTRSLALPVLVRYTLLAKPWKNLQVEALAGPILFLSRGTSDFTRTENGLVTTRLTSASSIRNVFLAAGPSVRYDVGRHLAGFADWLFYKNLQANRPSYSGSNLNNQSGITTAVNLGVQYRFGY